MSPTGRSPLTDILGEDLVDQFSAHSQTLADSSLGQAFRAQREDFCPQFLVGHRSEVFLSRNLAALAVELGVRSKAELVGNLCGADGGEFPLFRLGDGEKVNEVVVGRSVEGRVSLAVVEDNLSVTVSDALAEEGRQVLLAKVPSGIDDLDQLACLCHEVFALFHDADETEEVEAPEEEGHALAFLDGAAQLDELAQVPEASVGDEGLGSVAVVGKAV